MHGADRRPPPAARCPALAQAPLTGEARAALGDLTSAVVSRDH
ncbi:hypothetical protein L083_4120 [Actinoplanes sp. N902-109]|nr:hypothetical protein L083_4120 [Actinoplanes sp. N902-109]